MGGDDDDLHPWKPSSHWNDEIQAGSPTQTNIQQHDIEGPAGSRLHGLFRRRRAFDAMIALFEANLQNPTDGRLVIHDKDVEGFP
jgi:hypothetical protein